MKIFENPYSPDPNFDLQEHAEVSLADLECGIQIDHKQENKAK